MADRSTTAINSEYKEPIPADAAEALARIVAEADPLRAEGMRAYHKAEREYLGTGNPILNDLAMQWRRAMTAPQRVAIAAGLWDTDIHEARILAAKLLTQARIKPDDGPAWRLIASWVPQFDAWAIADHACAAGQRRLLADPRRLDEVEEWTRSEHMWTRRAALVITLAWARMPHPSAAERAARKRILGWAAGYVPDRNWFIQKAIAWWLRDLSRHEPEATRAFLAEHGADMKAFARKEAARHL